MGMTKEERREYNKNYYLKNKDEILESKRNYYKDNKDEILESQRKYYEDNKDEILESQREYYNENKAKILTRMKEYNQTPAGKIRKHKHRAKRRNFGFKPLTPQKFANEEFHHLHLEDNHEFGIFVPDYLHEYIYHNSFSGAGMEEINAIAIQYWLDDELYSDD